MRREYEIKKDFGSETYDLFIDGYVFKLNYGVERFERFLLYKNTFFKLFDEEIDFKQDIFKDCWKTIVKLLNDDPEGISWLKITNKRHIDHLIGACEKEIHKQIDGLLKYKSTNEHIFLMIEKYVAKNK